MSDIEMSDSRSSTTDRGDGDAPLPTSTTKDVSHTTNHGATQMPNWTTTPPEHDHHYTLPLVRTPANRPIRSIITSHELVGCTTHWYGGHTIPCTAPDCPACDDSAPARWHGYIAIYNYDTQHHAILEITAAAAETLLAHRHQHGTLRACQIEAYRWHQRPNGRLMIRCKQLALPQNALPAPPNVRKIMEHIWQLDANTPPETQHTTTTTTTQTTTTPSPTTSGSNNRPKRQPHLTIAQDTR